MGQCPPTISDGQSLLNRCREIRNNLIPKDETSAFVFLDTETTGLSPNSDWLYEIAALFVAVRGGEHQRVHAFHSYLNWVDTGLVSFAELEEKVNKTNHEIAQKDPSIRRPSADEIVALGKHPSAVLGDFAKVVNEFFTSQAPCRRVFSGHNAFSFDSNFLHQSYAKVGIVSPIGGEMLDTGLLLKAAQVTGPEYCPKSYQYSVDWMLKVRNARLKGVKWSLADFCDPLFKLKAKLPPFVDAFKHTSVTDVWMTYTLFKLIDGCTE
jgi:DNA polymerase III alpha subunit (gram-positive type)